MSLDYIRRLAAEVAGVGKSRIYIDPDEYESLSTVIAKEEVRKLIKEGIIKVLPKKGITNRKKIKKRGKGEGSIKGKKVRIKKVEYVTKVRSLRKFAKQLYLKNVIDNKTYRKIRKYIKAGVIDSKAKIKSFISQHGSSS